MPRAACPGPHSKKSSKAPTYRAASRSAVLWHGHVDVATVGARHFRYGVIFDPVLKASNCETA